jgi:hypothetical protein
MPQTAMCQIFSFKQKSSTGRNAKHPMSTKCSVTHETEFNARQRGPLFWSEQTRRQKLRILVNSQTALLKQCTTARPLQSLWVTVSQLAHTLAAAFTVQRTYTVRKLSDISVTANPTNNYFPSNNKNKTNIIKN